MYPNCQEGLYTLSNESLLMAIEKRTPGDPKVRLRKDFYRKLQDLVNNAKQKDLNVRLSVAEIVEEAVEGWLDHHEADEERERRYRVTPQTEEERRMVIGVLGTVRNGHPRVKRAVALLLEEWLPDEENKNDEEKTHLA